MTAHGQVVDVPAVSVLMTGGAALRPLADIRGELVMRRVLRLLAARTAHELVLTDLARDADLDRSTLTSYLALLEALFLGSLFETTVLTEIAKQATWSEHLVDLSHFRDRNGPEVDLVVEDQPHRGGRRGRGQAGRVSHGTGCPAPRVAARGPGRAVHRGHRGAQRAAFPAPR